MLFAQVRAHILGVFVIKLRVTAGGTASTAGSEVGKGYPEQPVMAQNGPQMDTESVKADC